MFVYFPKRTNHQYLFFFPPFLLLTLFVEIYGSFLSSIKHNNILLYNIFSIIEFSFYLFIIGRMLRNPIAKRLIIYTVFIYEFMCLVNISFIQGLKTFNTVTFAIGCILIVFACIFYFFELFRLPKTEDLYKNPAFWICTGLLFFYSCGFPLYGFVNFWAHISPSLIRNFGKIMAILNMLLYSLFTISFLCLIPRKFTL